MLRCSRGANAPEVLKMASLPQEERGRRAEWRDGPSFCTPPCEGVAPSGAPSGVLLRRRAALSGRPSSRERLLALPGLPPFLTASPEKPRARLNGRTVSQLLAGSPYWPPGGAPTPPGCAACWPRPQAPVLSTRAGATGSRPSWERTTIGILSYRNIVKLCGMWKIDGARVQGQCAGSKETGEEIFERFCRRRCRSCRMW